MTAVTLAPAAADQPNRYGVQTMSSLFERLPSCSPWCEGHVDETVTVHGTELDYFGPGGPVVVTQQEDGVPLVSLVDLDHPQADFDPREARTLAMQLWLAADFAERAATPDLSALIERAVAEALAAAGVGPAPADADPPLVLPEAGTEAAA